MPSIVKQKLLATSRPNTGRKSGICLSGSQLNLTPRPGGNSSSGSSSPVKLIPSQMASTSNKKQRPKSAVPTIRRQPNHQMSNEQQKLRPLSAEVPVTAKIKEKVESNLPSPASDEISIWMSDEMLRAEKSLGSASTSNIISPFSEESEKNHSSNSKHLRFADENSDDFISSVVEQLKEQVRYEINEESGMIRKTKAKPSSKNFKPKSIAELLDIIDGEIPFELKGPKRSNFKPSIIHETKKQVKRIRRKSEVQIKANEDEYEAPIDKMDKVETKVSEIQNHELLEETQDESEKQKESVGVKATDNRRPSNDCLKSIFSFLDKMEKTEIQPSRLKPLQLPEEMEVPLLKGGKQMQILKEALEEKTAHVQLLKETLLQTKVETADALSAADKEQRIMTRKQKFEYESALKKLQDGTEKLISDKKNLVEKVEELVQKLRDAESKHLGAIQALQQRHTVDIARTKQIAAAAEKVRREKWVERQTARIKELTVKGLEPELTRLNLQHENKVALIQASHSKELQAQVEAESRRVDEIRSLMLKEKDEELARERTMISERYERQLAEERAMMEIRGERIKEEAAAEMSRQQAKWSAMREDMIAQAWQETQRVQALHDQHILLLDEKKQAEISAAKEELREEQSAWLTAQHRKNAELLSAKQQELKEQRDKEIEKAIDLLEAEERRSRSDHEKETEKKITRLKEQHKAILADRDLNEKLMLLRLNESQKIMEQSEKQLLTAKASESRLKQELCISEQRVEALEGEHARIRELVEKQFTKQISELEEKMELLKQERDAQLEQVHERVKGVLEKKEQYIEQLKVQEADLAKRCKHLESLLGR